jgi:hypothetical protein
VRIANGIERREETRPDHHGLSVISTLRHFRKLGPWVAIFSFPKKPFILLPLGYSVYSTLEYSVYSTNGLYVRNYGQGWVY